MDEIELRCEHCATTHPARRPTLLATVRAGVALMPVRIPARLARAGGVARTGMFWRKAPTVDGVALLRCRRCGTLTNLDMARLSTGKMS